MSSKRSMGRNWCSGLPFRRTPTRRGPITSFEARSWSTSDRKPSFVTILKSIACAPPPPPPPGAPGAPGPRGRGRPGAERARPGADAAARMTEEVREGLRARPLPTLPCKYFYDDRGSALFDEITRLPEYYQTRTEERLLETIAAQVVGAVRPRELCELGSGAGRKIRLFLDAMRARGRLERCTLLDINETFLTNSVHRLVTEYPGLAVRGVVGDFLEDLPALGPGGARLALFLAGTIGK